MIEKFGENNIPPSEGVSSNELKELWSPIRLMKNQIAVIQGNNENEYFLAGEVSSIRVYISYRFNFCQRRNTKRATG